MFSISYFFSLLVYLIPSAKEPPVFHGQFYLKSALLDSTIFHSTGIANRSHDIAIHDSTVFDIASLNKSFIANLVLQAVAEGRWQRTSSLNELLVQYGFEAHFHDSINLHQMLCHRSGLVDYDDLPPTWRVDNFRLFKRHYFSNHDYLNFIAGLEHGEPNQQFYYSNFAYHILPILLEAEYGLSFHELLVQKIATPLKMKYIWAPLNRRQSIPMMAEAYEYDSGSQSYLANDFIDLSLGRRIYASAPVLMQWLEARGGADLLPDSLASLVFQNHVGAINPEISYAYGWVSFEENASYQMGNLDIDQPYFIHGGSTGGFQSLAVSVNEGETQLIVLANHGDGAQIFKMAQKALKDFYD